MNECFLNPGGVQHDMKEFKLKGKLDLLFPDTLARTWMFTNDTGINSNVLGF